jgi:hypothetical protein
MGGKVEVGSWGLVVGGMENRRKTKAKSVAEQATLNPTKIVGCAEGMRPVRPNHHDPPLFSMRIV